MGLNEGRLIDPERPARRVRAGFAWVAPGAACALDAPGPPASSPPEAIAVTAAAVVMSFLVLGIGVPCRRSRWLACLMRTPSPERVPPSRVFATLAVSRWRHSSDGRFPA